MKRFFCTTCDSMKSVNRLPTSVENPLEKDPLRRVGQCKWHTDQQKGMTHAESIGSKKVHHAFVKTSKISVPKGKK